MNKKLLWLLPLLAVLGGLGYWFHGRSGETSAQPPAAKRSEREGRPLPVQAAAARRGDIDVTIDALGTVTARNTAVVKARVAGQLVRIAFREGQVVKAGETLAEIDPRPFQTQLDQADGQLARDKAMLANARVDLDRYRGLLKKDSIASQQVDNQEWLVRQYEGTVKNDQGVADNARLQLSFTRITAPLSGRLGLRQVDVGNFVQTSDPNGIVVMTQTQPINIVFAIPSDKLATVTERLRAGNTLSVDAFDRSGTLRLASGRLLTVDNQMDVTTGTVKLKAEFANDDDKLFPNQFVNVRLRVETRRDALLAPVAAIQRGSKGTFMYVIGEDKTITAQAVTLGPTAGDNVAVDNGLTGGERLVIDGADKLRDGARVEIAVPGAGKGEANAPAGPARAQEKVSPEDRQKRWADLNARIERGEFGEEIKKLPEEERRKRLRDLIREGQAPRSGNAQ